MRRFIGNTEVTVLTPSIALRNRYDTYGIDVNNASISLRVATPAGRSKFVPNERRGSITSRQTITCVASSTPRRKTVTRST
jgi:hypothetical protein